MNKAIIYARYSPRKNDQNCISIEMQLDYCKNYAAANGFEVISNYTDEAVSGKSAKRPGFQAAIDHATKSKLTVIVYSLSRFARSTKDAIEYTEHLNRQGANLVSIKEQIDTTTPMGRFFFTIMAALGQLERELTAERTADAMRSKQANGHLISDPNRIKYGYKLNPLDSTRILPDEHEQEIIRKILELRDANMGYSTIAKHLTDKAVPARSGKWHAMTVKRIIENYA